jgi:protein-S-isoprenylcysteine O-methyltransferase Ste14
MNHDTKTDAIGCILHAVTQGIGLVVGVIFALRFSEERSLLGAIAVWAGCLFASGIVAFIVMTIVTVPICKIMEKKGKA